MFQNTSLWISLWQNDPNKMRKIRTSLANFLYKIRCIEFEEFYIVLRLCLSFFLAEKKNETVIISYNINIPFWKNKPAVDCQDELTVSSPPVTFLCAPKGQELPLKVLSLCIPSLLWSRLLILHLSLTSVGFMSVHYHICFMRCLRVSTDSVLPRQALYGARRSQLLGFPKRKLLVLCSGCLPSGVLSSFAHNRQPDARPTYPALFGSWLPPPFCFLGFSRSGNYLKPKKMLSALGF